MSTRSSLVRAVGLFLGLLCVGVFTGCGAPRPTNILLITIDTLRADHLSMYGYGRQTSPVLDALAAEGIRFENPIVQWPKTGPSFTSIFTSTYPKDNGIVRRIGIPVPDQFRMLAEELKGQGYATRAVVANGALASEFNFQQGFDAYIESWKAKTGKGVDPTDGVMVNQLVETVMANHDPAQPFFLWVHYVDPHYPYEAPEPWKDQFVGDELYDPTEKLFIHPERPKKQMKGIGFRQTLDDREELDYYVARYDGEISYADAMIGELLSHLDERGLMDKTLTVVTSDHGESLGEHDYFFDHGRFGYQTCQRVPLIFHQSGVLEPTVFSAPVELLRLAPTLLEVAGVELEDGKWMQGRSLWPLLTGEEPENPESFAFSEAGYAVKPLWQRTVTDGRFKLIYAQDWGEQRWISEKGNLYTLYDLEADPLETTNIVREQNDQARRLNRALQRHWDQPPFLVEVESEGEQLATEDMDEETRRQLEALGYLD